ncbi:Dihydrolipoamide acetyltransferase component of pyruvate dehydrogenase complex [Minicystis rosea]|nr:Dihydrolipoamide acetyltransferase component of pyruvate dehydrogenase complex [Minicystis rosea]
MMNRSFRIFAVCAALAAPVLTGNHSASAQTAQNAGGDAAALAKSRELFQQANKLYDEGKYPQAEAAYLQAWKLKKSYDVAGNLGNLEADMNKPRAAAEHLSYAVREFPAGGRPALRDALMKRLGEVSRLVGTLRFQVNKPGAEVFVDGQSLGTSPIQNELYVDPGNHSVEARLEGYPPVVMNVTVPKGKTEQVSLTLVPPAGPSKAVIGAGAAVGGAAIVVGAVLLGVSASKGSTVSSLQTEIKAKGGCADGNAATAAQCSDLRDAGASKATLGNAGLWMLVGGGVVGVATLIYGVAGGGSTKAPARTGLRVLPVVSGDGGGLVLGGSF